MILLKLMISYQISNFKILNQNKIYNKLKILMIKNKFIKKIVQILGIFYKVNQSSNINLNKIQISGQL